MRIFFALGILKRDPGILIVSNDRVLIEFKFIDDNLECLEDFKVVKKDFLFCFSKALNSQFISNTMSWLSPMLIDRSIMSSFFSSFQVFLFRENPIRFSFFIVSKLHSLISTSSFNEFVIFEYSEYHSIFKTIDMISWNSWRYHLYFSRYLKSFWSARDWMMIKWDLIK